MSGAGSYPAGTGPAGADPVQTSTQVKALLPTALRYDAPGQDWGQTVGLDGATRYRSVHPTDQGFALGMCIKQGTLKHSPKTGNMLHKIQYLGGKDLQQQVERCVRSANPIARLVADGSATIRRIEVETSGGRLAVACYFKNNLTNRKNVALYVS